MKKVEKTRKKGVPKKGSNLGYFVPGAIFGKKCEKWPPNSPPSGTFLFFLTLPRSCFYTVAVLVVGGVQSGGKFFCSFLITFFGVWEFVLSILGVDIIQKGGGGLGSEGLVPHSRNLSKFQMRYRRDFETQNYNFHKG